MARSRCWKCLLWSAGAAHSNTCSGDRGTALRQTGSTLCSEDKGEAVYTYSRSSSCMCNARNNLVAWSVFTSIDDLVYKAAISRAPELIPSAQKLKSGLDFAFQRTAMLALSVTSLSIESLGNLKVIPDRAAVTRGSKCQRSVPGSTKDT